MKRLIAYITLLAFITSTYATITNVQSTSGNTGNTSGGATTFTMTLTNNPTVPNWIFGCVAMAASTKVYDITISGATAGAYSPFRMPTIVDAAPNMVNLFVIPVTTGATKVITVTTGSATVMSGVAVEYSADRGFIPDIWKSGVGNSGTAATGTSVTTAFPNELLVGCIKTRGAFASAQTGWLTSVTGSFSSILQTSSFSNSANADMAIAQLERIVSAAGTQATGGTLTSAVWGAGLYSFYEPTATPTATATATATNTPTPTPTATPTPSATVNCPVVCPTATFTPTATSTPTATPSATFTPTATATFTPTATATATSTFTPTPTVTPTATPTPTATFGPNNLIYGQ